MIPNPIATALKAAPEHRAETVAFAVYATYIVLAERIVSIVEDPQTPAEVRAALLRAYKAINPVMEQIPVLARPSARRKGAEPNRKPEGTPTPESPGVSMLPNQVYAGPTGEVVEVTFTDRTPPPGGLSAVDYNFEVTIDGEARRVSVRVLNEAVDALEAWKNEPANLFRILHGGSAHELAIDVCTVRILEAIEQGRALDDLGAITGAPEPIGKAAPSPATHLAIRKYVEQRLYAGYRHCGDSLDCAQQFGRIDWLWLKVTQRDVKKIVNDPRGCWKEVVQGHMYVQAEPYLVQKLEREFETATVSASSAPARSYGRLSNLAHDDDREFDVALSFAGEQRWYVERVARVLASRGVSYYYDDDEKIAMWGKDLPEHLADVFENRAGYVVMFISKEYEQKMWPRLERRSAMARAIREKREYILPARFDDTELPGLLHTVSYIPLAGLEPEEFAEMILEKIGRGTA